jgi:RNA polymerase sigma factor (sigma-70 family)
MAANMMTAEQLDTLYKTARRVARRWRGRCPGYDVDDLVQEAVMEAYRDFASYQPQEGKDFAAWCGKVADTTYHDVRRKAMTQGRDPTQFGPLLAFSEDLSESVSPHPGPLDALLIAERDQLIADAVQRLSPHQQKVFEAVREGQSFAEVGRSYGLSRMTVSRQFAAIVDHINEYLAWGGYTNDNA